MTLIACIIAYAVAGAFFCWFIAWDEMEVGNDPKSVTRIQWAVVFTFWPLWILAIVAISMWERRKAK